MQFTISSTPWRRIAVIGMALASSIGVAGGASARETAPEAAAAASKPRSALASKSARCPGGKVPLRRGGRLRCERKKVPRSSVTLTIEHEDGMALVATRRSCDQPYRSIYGNYVVLCLDDVYTANAQVVFQQVEVLVWTGYQWVFWYAYRI